MKKLNKNKIIARGSFFVKQITNEIINIINIEGLCLCLEKIIPLFSIIFLLFDNFWEDRIFSKAIIKQKGKRVTNSPDMIDAYIMGMCPFQNSVYFPS